MCNYTIIVITKIFLYSTEEDRHDDELSNEGRRRKYVRICIIIIVSIDKDFK